VRLCEKEALQKRNACNRVFGVMLCVPSLVTKFKKRNNTGESVPSLSRSASPLSTQLRCSHSHFLPPGRSAPVSLPPSRSPEGLGAAVTCRVSASGSAARTRRTQADLRPPPFRFLTSDASQAARVARSRPLLRPRTAHQRPHATFLAGSPPTSRACAAAREATSRQARQPSSSWGSSRRRSSRRAMCRVRPCGA